MVKTKNNYIKIFIEASIFMYKVSTVRRKSSNSYEQKMDWAPWSHCSIPKEKKSCLYKSEEDVLCSTLSLVYLDLFFVWKSNMPVRYSLFCYF